MAAGRPGRSRRWVLAPVWLACLLLALVAACSQGAAPEPRASASPGQSAGGTSGSAGPSDAGSGGAAAPGERPNLLVIEADDMRADDLRWMPRTRRLLGGTGLSFQNSFSPDPLCCPARASFLTGRYPHNHRVLSHEPPYGFTSFDDRRTLATALQAAGYRTALVGKYLNGYGVQPTHDGGDSSAYVPPGWSQWYGSVDGSRTLGGGTYDYFRLTTLVNGVQRSWPGEYTTDVTARQVQGLVRRFERAGGQPWFLWWTPVAPHHGGPREPGDPYPAPEPNGNMILWDSPARPDWVKGRFDDRIRHGPGLGPGGVSELDVRDKPSYIRQSAELDDRERAWLTSLTRQRAEALFVLDLRIAETLRTLRRSGAAADTVVAFTSDNGFYLGEHRRRLGKVTLHEPSARVPLLLTGPGVPRGERFDPVTTLDLTATLAGLADVRPDDLGPLDGRDLWPLVTGGDQGWEHPMLLEARMLNERYAAAGDAPGWAAPGLSTSGIRLGRYKLVRYAPGAVELYDLARDPLEMRSIASSRPGLRRQLTALWERYADCDGPSCTAPAPEAWQVDAAENERITRAQQQAVADLADSPQ